MITYKKLVQVELSNRKEIVKNLEEGGTIYLQPEEKKYKIKIHYKEHPQFYFYPYEVTIIGEKERFKLKGCKKLDEYLDLIFELFEIEE